MSSALSVGSVCSGIEAASVAWNKFDFAFKWFSEISDFPSRSLEHKYPAIPNLGDMCVIPDKLKNEEIEAPDVICGGTPCQAFSLAGWRKGLEDSRGNLTLKFVDIVERNDLIRAKKKKAPGIVLWENVEGVLKDKTNAFGAFISSLAGLEAEINFHRWPRSGLIRGPKRNVAWRVLDAKYFGLPQQRRRLYVLAGGTDFLPEDILFDGLPPISEPVGQVTDDLRFIKDGHSIEVFRHYTDCLYSAYGTKWNGNAAAYNGSLYVQQDNKLRRFTPLECERLMGFPDNYTDVFSAKPTARYQAIGNSWAIPVIEWLGDRIINVQNRSNSHLKFEALSPVRVGNDYVLYDVQQTGLVLVGKDGINGTEMPENVKTGCLRDIVDINADSAFYISPAGCRGILRRKAERNIAINPRLEKILKSVAAMWSDEEIEKISRIQPRGKFSQNLAMAQQFQVRKEAQIFVDVAGASRILSAESIRV